MADHTMRERIPPVRLGQKGDPFAVGDKVRVRDGKTFDRWPAVVMAIQGDDMTVEWVTDGAVGAYANVPLASVRHIGADGGYADGASGLGGASSNSKANHKRKRTKPWVESTSAPGGSNSDTMTSPALSH